MPKEEEKGVHSVDSKGQRLFQECMNLDEDDFQEECIKKKNEFDMWLNFCNKQLNTNIVMETAEILDESPINREEWTTFYIYMEYVNDFMKKFSFNFKKYL